MQRRAYALAALNQQRTALSVVAIMLLIALISGSVAAQTVDVPPLDFERYSIPLDAQNVGQVERLLVKQFPDYMWVDEFAIDATGRVVAADGPNNDRNDHSIIVWKPDSGDTRRFDLMDGLAVPDDYRDSDTRLAVSPDGSKLAAATYWQRSGAGCAVVYWFYHG